MKIDRDVLSHSWKNWLGGPLERVGPVWLPWLWTLLFAACIALAFTIIGFGFHASRGGSNWASLAAWKQWYSINFVVSLTIAVTIHLLFMVGIALVGAARIRRFSRGGKALFFNALPLIGWRSAGPWASG